MPSFRYAFRWFAIVDTVFSPFWKKTILLLSVISCFYVIPDPGSWNDQSRMATIESIVERGTMVIDNSTFVSTGDKLHVNGHFYSDKTPFSSLIGAIVYIPLYMLGFRLSIDWSVAYYCITLFTINALWALSIIAFHNTLKTINKYSENNAIHTLCFGLASMHLSWSSVYNNHSLAASLIAIAFYFYIRSRHTEQPAPDMLVSGFLFALAGNIDVPTAAFYAVFLVLIVMDATRRRYAVHFLLPGLFLAIPALAMNYSITGNLGFMQINKSYFDYPGSPWTGPEKLSGIEMNTLPFALTYAVKCLLGQRGFLLHNPLLFVFVPYLVGSMFKPSSIKRDWIGIVAASATIMAYYFLYTSNFGGASYSIRWFVPLLPLLYLGGYPFFVEFTERKKRVFAPLFLISMWIAATGMTNPWTMFRWHRVPFIDNTIDFLLTLF